MAWGQCSVPVSLVTGQLSAAAPLQWQGVAGAVQGYEVRVQSSLTGPFTSYITSASAADVSYTLGGLVAGKVYRWQVRALCAAGVTSAWSDSARFYTVCRAATTPITVRSTDGAALSAALVIGGGLPVLRWEADYRVLGAPSWTTVGANVLPIGVYGLSQGVTYEYRLRPFCTAGAEAWAVGAVTTTATFSPIASTYSKIYREGLLAKAVPYRYPGLDTLGADAVLYAQLKAVKNLPTTAAQELGFWERGTDDLERQRLLTGGFGSTFFESEKSSYANAMNTMAWGLSQQNTSRVAAAKSFLQGNSSDVCSDRTSFIDLYPAFTLKQQATKYFYFGKWDNQLDATYMATMRQGMTQWTTSDATDPKLPGTTPRDPYFRSQPCFTGTPTGECWTANCHNSWSDVRNTDNLKAMRETTTYLFAEEVANETVRLIYKQRITDHVAALYHIGYSEWESENYMGHSMGPFLNLYAYSKDPAVKKLGKAALDWYMTCAIMKYLNGGLAGPSKRMNGGSNANLGNDLAMALYGFFGASTKPAVGKRDRDAFMAFVGGYRPPQALYSLYERGFPAGAEQLNTKPPYASFSPTSAAKPDVHETMFYGKGYILGSAISQGAVSDMRPFRLTARHSTRGSEVFQFCTVPTTYADASLGSGTGDPYGTQAKLAGDQIGQYRNLAIYLRPAPSSHKFWMQLPASAQPQQVGGVWFAQMEQAWIAIRPINIALNLPQIGTGDYVLDRAWPCYPLLKAGRGYCGMAMEVVDAAANGGPFATFAAFRAAVLARPLDTKRLDKGELAITGTDGATLRMRHNPSNDKPFLYRNGAAIPFAYDDAANFGTYKAVSPPTAAITGITGTGCNLTITATAADPEAGTLTQGWKQGVLKVVSEDYVFTSTVTAAGAVTWSEQPTTAALRRGQLALVELYCGKTRVAQVTDAGQLAGGAFSFGWGSPPVGGQSFRLRAVDVQGTETWSAPFSYTVPGSCDGTAPAAPAPAVAVAATYQLVNLSWTAPAAVDLAGYRIYRSTQSGFGLDDSLLIADGLPAGQVSYADNQVDASTTHYYAVVAVDASGNASGPARCQAVTPAQPSTTQIAASADAYGRAGPSYETVNYGYNVEMVVKYGSAPSDESWREAFVAFPITGLSGTVQLAKLRLYGRLSDLSQSNIAVSCFQASGAAWAETGVSFLTRPGADGGLLASTTVTDNIMRWYEWDVTGAVAQALSEGATAVSFLLRGPSGQIPFVTFATREAGVSTTPILVVQSVPTVTSTYIPPTAALELPGGGVSAPYALAGAGWMGHNLSAFTLEAWTKLADLTIPHTLACKGDGAVLTQTAWAVALQPVVGQPGQYQLGLMVRDGWVYSSPVTLTTDDWYHWAASYSGAPAEQVALYLDGKQIALAFAPSGTLRIGSTVTAGLELGRRANAGEPLKGQLNEVCLWARALSQAEIREGMNLLLTNPERQVDLAGYWPLDGANSQSTPASAPDARAGVDAAIQLATFSPGQGQWVSSRTPLGAGQVSRQVVASNALVNFSGTNAQLQFSGAVPGDEVVVTRLAGAMRGARPTDGGAPYADTSQYWVIRNYGVNTGLSAALTLTYGPGLVPSGPDVRLARRESGSEGAWALLSAQNGLDGIDVINQPLGVVRYRGLAGFSQFAGAGEVPSPVPVRFISVSARRVASSGVQVQFSVIQHGAERDYQIERSQDGKIYSLVGAVAARPLARTEEYTFIDKAPLPTSAYYRIRGRDFDGQELLSPIAYLEGKPSPGTRIQVWPVPASHTVFIGGLDLQDGTTVILVDALGRRLQVSYQAASGGGVEVDISRLPAGVYMLEAAGQRARVVRD